MHIAGIHVDGFGRLANVTMDDVPLGLSIVLGENEAGKTTLLEFVRSILFGLPSRKQKDFYPPLNGGRKGGRIILVNNRDERIIVERFEGKGTGSLTVTLPDGSQGREPELRQLLGSATDDLYRNVFAFSLSELQSFESLKTEKVRDAIYSAGIGIGRRTIAQVIQELAKNRDELFVPGGSRPAMNKLLSGLEERARQIKGHDRDQDDYESIQEEFAACEARLERIGSELKQARQRASYLQVLQQVRQDWLTLGDCREQLQRLTPIPCFPVDGVKRFDELITERRGFRGQWEQTATQIESDRTKLREIQVDDILLNAAEDIRRLDRGLTLHEENRQQFSSLITSRGLAEQKLAGMLRELGEEWNEQKLAAFDLSVPVRQEVEQCRQDYEAAMRSLRECKLAWELAGQEEAQDRESQNDAQTKLNNLQPDTQAPDTAGIRKLQLGWERYASAREDHPRIVQDCATRIEHLQDTLRKVGPQWTEAKLRSFDTSMDTQQELLAHQKGLADRRAEVMDAARRVEAARQAVEDGRSNYEAAQAVLAALPRPEVRDGTRLAETQRACRALRTQLTQTRQRQPELIHLQERRQDVDRQLARLERESYEELFGLPVWLLWLVLVLGIVALVGLGLGRGDWVTASFVFVLSVAATIGLAVLRRTVVVRAERQRVDRTHTIHELQERRRQLDDAAGSLQRELEHAESALRQRALATGFANVPEGHALDDVESQIEGQLAVLQQVQPAEQKCDEAQMALAKAQTLLDQSTQAISASETRLDEVQKQWRQWLVQAELPDSLTPEDATAIFGRLDAAREQLKTIDRERIRVSQMSDAIRDYESQVNAVAMVSGLERCLPKETREALEFLEARLEAYEQHTQAMEEARRNLADAVKKVERAEIKTARARELYEAARVEEEMCHQQWAALKRRLGLRDSLGVESAPQMLQAIERARDQLVHAGNLREEETALQATIDAFCDDARDECLAVGRSAPVSTHVSKVLADLMQRVSASELIDGQ